MAKKVALINIGDSPIAGIEEEIQYYFSDFEVVEEGALDGMSKAELDGVLHRGEGDILTVERNDGSFVRLSKEAVDPYVGRAIERAKEQGCQIFYLHCTGFFPKLTHKGILIKPGRLLKSIVTQFSQETTVAILTPTPQHIGQVERKWSEAACRKTVIPVHPFDYRETILKKADEWSSYDVLLLDCTSYGMAFVRELRKYYKGLILCPLTMAFAQCKGIAEI